MQPTSSLEACNYHLSVAVNIRPRTDQWDHWKCSNKRIIGCEPTNYGAAGTWTNTNIILDQSEHISCQLSCVQGCLWMHSHRLQLNTSETVYFEASPTFQMLTCMLVPTKSSQFQLPSILASSLWTVSCQWDSKYLMLLRTLGVYMAVLRRTLPIIICQSEKRSRDCIPAGFRCSEHSTIIQAPSIHCHWTMGRCALFQVRKYLEQSTSTHSIHADF